MPEDGSPILTREQFQLPEVLNEGEVLLKLDGATICNSDVHTMTGRRKVTIILTLMMMMMIMIIRSRPPGCLVTRAVARL